MSAPSAARLIYIALHKNQGKILQRKIGYQILAKIHVGLTV
jgi:hypothetical protein